MDNISANFESYIDKINAGLKKLKTQFEFASLYCGDRRDGGLCRHQHQLFLIKCNLRDCPLLKK